MSGRDAKVDGAGEFGAGHEASAAPLPVIDDYYKWAFEQAAHIRAGRFDQVDILNVADEIESVGKTEARSVTSAVEIILLHMLKWAYQPSRRARSWTLSIVEHRQRVIDDLKDNPSLRGRVDIIITRAYRLARYGAARQTKLSLKTFPDTCPYSWEQIMEAPHDLTQD